MTKDKILKGGLLSVFEQGFHAVSVRDIARAVGIKRALFITISKQAGYFDRIVDVSGRMPGVFPR